MLAALLSEHRTEIEKFLYLGYTRWDKLEASVARAEEESITDFYDEEAWTFLLACTYAINGKVGCADLSRRLTDGQLTSSRIWAEVLPNPPRERESNTHLDLALGAIKLREGTKSGIEYDQAGSGICFVEVKWYSDISNKVSNDQHRNQFARVIENATCFKADDGSYPDTIHATLLSPGVFRSPRPWSRLYQYKWDEYQDTEDIRADLEACTLPKRSAYPDLQERLSRLKLHWASFEELFEAAPASPIREQAQRLFSEKRGEQLKT